MTRGMATRNKAMAMIRNKKEAKATVVELVICVLVPKVIESRAATNKGVVGLRRDINAGNPLPGTWLYTIGVNKNQKGIKASTVCLKS